MEVYRTLSGISRIDFEAIFPDFCILGGWGSYSSFVSFHPECSFVPSLRTHSLELSLGTSSAQKQ